MSGKTNIAKYSLLKVKPLDKNIFHKIGDALGDTVGAVSNLIGQGINDLLSVGNFVGQMAKLL